MAELRIPSAPRGEFSYAGKQTTADAVAVDTQIKVDAPSEVNVYITKPAGATTTIRLTEGSDGEPQDIPGSSGFTAGATIKVENVQMGPEDQLDIQIDTNVVGAKTVKPRGKRLVA